MNSQYTVPQLYVRGTVRSWVTDGADFTVEEVFHKMSKMLSSPISFNDNWREYIENTIYELRDRSQGSRQTDLSTF